MNLARIALLTLACLTACKRKDVDGPPDVGPDLGGPQPELVVQAGSHHLVADVGFSPDGRWLAVASVDGLLKVFEVRTGKEWRTYSGAAGPIYNVSWTSDGKRIAAGGLDKTVHIWDVASGAELAALPGHSQWVGSVEFSPDGRHLASAAKFGDLVVAVWDVETRALRHALTHTRTIRDLAWSVDGKTLLTAGQELVVWNAETGGRLGEVPIDSTAAKGTALAFSPDGGLVAIAGAGDLVHVYDPRTWAEVRKLPATALVAWHRDGTLIVQSGAEVVRVDPRSGQKVSTFAGPQLAGAALSRDSRLGARYEEMDVYLFDVETGAQLRKIESTFWKHVGGVYGNATSLLQVAWSPTAPIVAMAGFDGVLRVIDLRRGVTPRTIQISEQKPPPPPGEEKFLGHTWSRLSIITSLAFTGDGAHILATDGERLTQWDVRSLTRIREYAAPGGADAHSFAPDGKSIAIAHGNAVISVYDTTTGQLLRRSDGGGLDAGCEKGQQTLSTRASLAGLGWSIDGKRLYVVHADSATFAELDAQTFQPQKGGCAHHNRVNNVAWSDARDKVAIAAGLHMLNQLTGETGAGDNTVNVFATNNDMPRLHSFRGHKLAVMAADFSPNGNLLATGSADRTARLWDVRSGAEVATIAGHGAEVSGVAFSHDNRFLATSSYDLSVKVWDVAGDPARPAEVATIVSIGPDASVIETPDHYYTATRAGFASVSFRLGDTVVPVELFDLRLNRPDLVLRRFGYAPADLIALYEKAHAKRLKKMGLTEDALRPEYHLPTVRFTGDVPLSTGERRLSVPIVAEDTRYPLDRLQVYVNDVPIHGTRGVDLRGEKTRTDERTLDIDLLPGRNKIQVAALNAAGTESNKATVEVVSTAPARPGTLYVVSVGVSRYADVRLNLKYAAKDAKDIAGLFQGRGKRFDRVEVVEILDDEAVRENILAARKRLAASTVDDQVVVFVAGHGMLDQSLDYYFVTHDFDRDKPPRRGLSYDQLESLLDGIPARRKLMMMDTCHSGEVDDEAMRAPPPPPGTSGVKMTADFRTFSYGGEIQSPDRSGEVLAHLFADLRRGAGAAVISSASGAEFALESARWQNGVFTYAVLQGLTSGDADRDRDGTVQVSELRDYVIDEVHRLTRGAQTPTARRENLEFDFSVF